MSARSRCWVWLPALVVILSWGSTASAAIDELEVILDGGASTFPTPTAYGSATQVAGQHWELTPATANQSGGVTYAGLSVGDMWSVTGQFWSGGGSGADAFYVYTWAVTDPAAEDSADQQYTFAYDEWDDQIQILYNGGVLASASDTGLDSSGWRDFRVDCTEGLFEMYLDGVLRLTYDERMHLYGIAIGDRFGFGARTGPTETNEHRVRNMVWDVTSSAGTSALSVSTEGGAPTFPTGTGFGGAVDGGLAWQLDFVNTNDHGGVSYSSVALGERFDLTGEFRSGGGTGADIFYAFLWADTEPAWQSDTNGQYAVSFDEYNDQIKLIYSGTTLAFYNHTTLDDRAWHAFQVSCDTGVFDVWIDGSPVITYDDSANFAARATGTLSGFAGGSGGESNAHQVRNMHVDVGATSTPSVVWSSSFARRAFRGDQSVAMPDGTIQSDTSLTFETWFRTNTSGVIFGYQGDPAAGAVVDYYTPALRVGTDGLLRGVFWSEAVGVGAITSAGAVNDGEWHHVALLGDDDQSTLYLDGTLVGVANGAIDHFTQDMNQVGTGYTLNWPAGNGGWHYFEGEIGAPTVWDGPLAASAVTTIAATPPAPPDVEWSTSTGVVTTYDGVGDYTTADDWLIQTRVAFTVETWFRTTETRGGLFGYQTDAYPTTPSLNMPALYIHSDGRMGGGLWRAANPPMFSPSAVNDGAWHHVALVGDVDRHHMYVDGALAGTHVDSILLIGMLKNQVGLAYTNWVGGANTWDFFRGDIADFNVWDGTLTAAEVTSIAAAPPTAPVPNLTATFGGNTNYLDVGTDASLVLTDEYTLEAWIRPTGSGAGGADAIICREGEYLVSWFPTDQSIRYAVGNAGWVWISTGYTTPLGVWRHIAFTSSAADGTIRLYADGVEVYSAAGGGTIVDTIPAQNNTYLGDRQSGTESFEGDLDEVRIWNVTRSAAEIASTYARTLTAGEAVAVTGLVGYWNFDDGTTTDITGNGNDGTFTGNAGILGSQQTFGANGAAPTADASSATAANGPENYIQITGSDPDGDPVTFNLVNPTSDTMGLPLTIVDADPTDNTATVLYMPSADGADGFSFTVTDGIEASAPAAVSITVSSPTNYDVAFDGSADYLDVGVDASLVLASEFTLEAWIYPTGAGGGALGDGTIVCREGEYLLSWYSDGTIRYAMGNDGWVWRSTGYVVGQNEWTHVAFAHADGVFTLYLNGAYVDSFAAISGTVTDYLTGLNNVWVGGRQSGEATFQGELDEVRVWNVARDAAEIASSYDRTFTLAEAQAIAGLQGYWTFDDQNASDLTLNANNGTFVGNAAIAPSGQAFGANGVAPVADAGISATVETSQTVEIQITGTDGDGDFVAFELVSAVSDTLGGPLTLTDADPTDNLATVTYDATSGAGADTFSFTVSDGVETSSPQSVAVTVNLPAVAWSTSTGVVTLYDGVADYEEAPDSLIQSHTSVTVETWFRTTATKGVIFGYQNAAYPTAPGNRAPALYVGSDGLLRGGLWAANAAAPLNSGVAVNDAAWHHAAVVADGSGHHLYVDGVLAGTNASATDHLDMTSNQVGVGYDFGWVGGAGGWAFYRGDLADLNVWDGALAASDVAGIAATPPTQEAPNLTASFAGGAGTPDYMNAGADASLVATTGLTVEAWMYPTGLGSAGASGGTYVSKEGEYSIARWGGTGRSTSRSPTRRPGTRG